ncbi:hypothetical protein DERP_003281 [Dermatophagoides pteronyssinus]|uniref:Uncharacterized protein n=1 Tax=Dermatophagoides pteronyssinus TaxID=6956 RepID=A0ABQ8JJ32_DERPT|nr:hypothetical protein DERP_003281 [Dermatophagoides pteronyssinus]
MYALQYRIEMTAQHDFRQIGSFNVVYSSSAKFTRNLMISFGANGFIDISISTDSLFRPRTTADSERPDSIAIISNSVEFDL